jgi:hypothetical protein
MRRSRSTLDGQDLQATPARLMLAALTRVIARNRRKHAPLELPPRQNVLPNRLVRDPQPRWRGFA